MANDQSKISIVFDALLSGHQHTRLSAAKELNDWTFIATVWDIERLHKVKISRKEIQLRKPNGKLSRYNVYWIEPEEAAQFIARKKKTPSKGRETNFLGAI